MTHQERIQSIADLFEFGFPIPLAINVIEGAFSEETGEDLNDTLIALLQTAIKQGIKQGANSMRFKAMEAIKQIEENG